MTTQAAPGARLKARLWQNRGRLCFAFDFSTGPVAHPDWVPLIADLKRTFVVPRLACRRPTTYAWSFRPSARTRLMEWCAVWHIDVEEEGSR